MGMGPSRVDTPRTGLEDLIAGLFSNTLTGAGAPGGAPPPSYTPPGGGPPGGGSTGGIPGGGFFGGGYHPLLATDLGTPTPTNRPPVYSPPAVAPPPGGVGPGGGVSPAGGGPMDPGSALLQQIFSGLSIPQYGGPMTAPTNALQQGAMGASQASLAALPGFAQLGKQVATGLRGVSNAPAAPSFLTQMLTNRPGTDMLRSIGAPGGIESQLANQGNSSGGDFAGILQALDASRQTSLSNNLRDISERFSTSGLRNSTDLATSLGQTSNQSNQDMLGIAAQLLPQLAGLKTQALTSAGQLGLGAGSALQSGDIGASDILGQLYQGQQGRGLSALQSLPGAAQLFASIPQQAATSAYNIGSQNQAQDTAAMQAKLQEFIRSQGALFSPILNFASGAPQITGPGKGSQLLGAGTSIAGAFA